MKIIKNGKLERRFKCPRCKCKFKASFEEYSTTYNIPTQFKYIYKYIISINCPYCNFHIEIPERG